MARPRRITIPGVPHHIVQRGNNKNSIFFEREDFEQYLRLLSRYSQKYEFRILSFCLMTNHVHIVGIPSEIGSMSSLMRSTQHRYSLQLNRKMGKSGHNWYSRYYSCPCDEFHGVSSMRYVELNPVRAGIVKEPWDYMWSSAMYHVGQRSYPEFLDRNWWNKRFSPRDWEELLVQTTELDSISLIRNNTKSGRPLGSKEFREMVKSQAGVEKERRLRGRPKKNGA